MGTAIAPDKSGSWSFGGYGEALLLTSFYSPDPKVTRKYRQTNVDLRRIAFFAENRLSESISFVSEIEFEHGGTGVSKEVEWEEFGEYETEVEKGGEIVLEQAYLEGHLSKHVSVRAGHLLVPVGMTSLYHTPNMFASTQRSESEAHLIPSIWHENGAELFFHLGDLKLRLQGITGPDSTQFSSDKWIGGGSQKGFESALANDWAFALGVEYIGVPGTMIGLSAYTSNTTQNRPKRDMDGIDARVYLGDIHLRGQYGPFRLRALAMAGTLSNAEKISQNNANLSSELGAPRTPVGSHAYAFFGEAALDVLETFSVKTRQRLDVFARYDAYDTMWKAPGNYENPLLQRQLVTTGLNYFPHPRVVCKAEYVSRWMNQDHSWSRRQQELNAALGFVL